MAAEGVDCDFRPVNGVHAMLSEDVFDAAAAAGKLSDPVQSAEGRALPYLQAVLREGLRIYPGAVPLSFKTVPAGGDDVTVTVADTCPGCAPGSVDLTPTAFQQLASLDVGRIHGISWTLL